MLVEVVTIVEGRQALTASASVLRLNITDVTQPRPRDFNFFFSLLPPAQS